MFFFHIAWLILQSSGSKLLLSVVMRNVYHEAALHRILLNFTHPILILAVTAASKPPLILSGGFDGVETSSPFQHHHTASPPSLQFLLSYQYILRKQNVETGLPIASSFLRIFCKPNISI